MRRFLLGVLVGLLLAFAFLKLGGTRFLKNLGGRSPQLEHTMDKLGEGLEDIGERAGRAYRELRKSN